MRLSVPSGSSEEATLPDRNRRTALALVGAVVLMMALWVIVAWVRN